MWPLLLCSVCSLTLIIWRILCLRSSLVIPSDLSVMLEQVCEGEDPAEEFVPRILEDQTTLGKLSREALQMHFAERTEAEKIMEARANKEMTRLQQGLPALEFIIQAAPLLGLLGTVAGMVTVFASYGGAEAVVQGEGNPHQIASGIAQSLNTTIFGLAIAVPTLLAHGFLQRKIDEIAAHVGVVLQRVVAARFNGTVTVD